MPLSQHRSHKRISGSGLLNTIINKLPFELHWPNYQYLGPGTKLHKRLARGDQGINPLDRAALKHDLFYDQHKDSTTRHIADKILEGEAWDRLKSKDAKLSERLAAAVTAGTMRVKRKLGLGIARKMLKKKKKQRKGKRKIRTTIGKALTFSSAVKLARAAVKRGKKNSKSMSDKELMKTSTKALKAIRKKKFTKIKNPTSRVIPLPQSGGALPLIPILAGLASMSTLASNAPTIVKNIKTILGFKNQTGSGLGSPTSLGDGLFLAPYKKGYGIFLKPKN